MKVVITESYLENIADAIRSKNGGSERYKPSQMAAAIRAISGLDDVIVDFDAMNSNAKAYMENVTYTDANYGTSQMENSSYLPTRGDYSKEDPVGYVLVLPHDGVLYIEDETDRTVPVQSYEVDEGNFTVYNLIPGHVNRWYLESNGSIIGSGRLRANGQLRMIYTDNLHNFRDIGGWECTGGRIKYGKIIRGGEANGVYNVEASAADIIRLRNLGIKQEVDMRGAAETAQTDDDPTNDITSSELGDDVYYAWLPNSVGTSMLTPGTTQYATFVQEMQLIIDRAIHGLPVYLHCQGGADRTGVSALMIEALLGVSKSDLSKDYELTSMYTVAGGMVGRYITDQRWLDWLNILDSHSGSTLAEKTASWFLAAGFTQETLNQFQAAMTEEVVIVIPVTGIIISGGVTPIYSGGNKMTLTANVTPSNATSTVIWESSDTSVAKVSSQGVVTTVSPGTAVISAKADGVTATYTMTVLDIADDPNILHHAVNADGTLYNDGAGYKAGYRLKSDGTETAYARACVTGFIPATEDDLVALSNISGLYITDSTYATYARIAGYDSEFNMLWNQAANAAVSKLTPATTSGDDMTSFTLKSSTNYPCQDLAYIRFSVYDYTEGQSGITPQSSIAITEEEEPEPVIVTNLLTIDGRTKGTGNSIVWSESYYWYQTTRNGSLSQRAIPEDAVISNARLCGTLHSAWQGIGFPVQLEVGKSYTVTRTQAVTNGQVSIGFFDSSGTCLSHNPSITTFTVPANTVWTLITFVQSGTADSFVDFRDISLVEAS